MGKGNDGDIFMQDEMIIVIERNRDDSYQRNDGDNFKQDNAMCSAP